MIQSVMLAAMGFIAASLLALLIAPAFWTRAVRLTSQRLRSALPLSEQEIRADKDLLRAEFALKVHQLERAVEQGRLSAHRQQIEINRRDIDLRKATETLAAAEASLSEHRNARSVLEQTVTERIPVLEASLAQARSILQARDAAINELQATAGSQMAALEDDRAILTQRALEVQRLQALLQEASAQGRDVRKEGSSDSLLLRAEIESLKSRLAERAAVIDRLQSEAVARPANTSNFIAPATGILPEDATSEQLRALISEQAAEIVQLRADMASRPLANESAAEFTDGRTLTARHVQNLEEQLRTQATAIAQLTAENEAISLTDDPTANARIRESKVWLRSRIQRAQDDLERERNTVGRLRAELAAGNERFARQASQFREELRRQSNRVSVPARDILRDAAKPQSVPGVRNGVAHAGADLTVAPPPVTSRARELQRALQGQFGRSNSSPEGTSQVATEKTAGGTEPMAIPAANNDAAPAPENAKEATADNVPRNRLLDRLKSYEQV